MSLNQPMKKYAAVVALVCLIGLPAQAQAQAQAQSQTQKAEAPSNSQPKVSAFVSADGELTGSVLKSQGEQSAAAPNTQVSLLSEGKVIATVKTNNEGQYSFSNVNPGQYEVVGSGDGYVGSQVLDVMPYVESQPIGQSRIYMYQSAPEVVYQSYATAPVSTFSTSPVTYTYQTSSYAGGGFGGGGGIGGGSFGGGIGSRLGGSLLRNPRRLLLIGGIAGGLAAINDSSPDQ